MFYRYVIMSMTTILLSLIAGKNFANSTHQAIPYYNDDEVTIKVDGKLDESIWEQVPYHDNFVVANPDLGKAGRYETRVRYFYTKRGLYVGMWNEQPTDTLLARLTSRDSFTSRDSMHIVVDPSGEGLYGYWFGVSLGGSIIDGIVLPERDYRREWDGAWYGNAAPAEGGWTAELYIPWAIMNLPPANSTVRNLGLYVSRSLGELGERWSSPHLSDRQNRFLSALNTYEIKSLSQSRDYSFFPYSSASVDNTRDTTDYRVGMDLFWRPSSYLQFSGTLNPDFGQVEADDVVVNLSAFETFFPEKRLFFLENQAVFSTVSRKSGSSNISLLNTRRIASGIGSRTGEVDDLEGVTTFDSQKPVDLVGALKATGQIGNLRYGLLAASEDDTDVSRADLRNIVSGRNFGIARLLYETTGGGGRRSMGWMGTVTDHPDRQAITQGIDAHLLSNDGRLSLDGQIMMSDVADERGYGFIANVEFVPSHGHVHQVEFDYIDRQLELNDLGFLPRTDTISVKYKYELEEPDVSDLKERKTEIQMRYGQNLDGKRTEADISGERRWKYTNNTEARVVFSYKPEVWDDRESRGFGDFKRPGVWGVRTQWNSDRAKMWSVELRGSIEQEHETGHKRSLRGELSFQPSGGYSLSLRADYEQRDAWLIHDSERLFTVVKSEQWSPKLIFDTFFTAKQQLQVQLQWIGIKARDRAYLEVPDGGGTLGEVNRPEDDTSDGFAISNLTLQVRYRWEIAPLSDLFVVYNRGGNLALDSTSDDFGSLFSSAFSDPTDELFVVKLRYRFGPG